MDERPDAARKADAPAAPDQAASAKAGDGTVVSLDAFRRK
jgi:hypothetical protein